MKNKWYNNQAMAPMEFILDTNIPGTKIIDLTDEQSLLIRSILDQEYSKNQHRCISVYRDTVVLDGTIHNICLSCGDIEIKGQIFYLTSFQEEALINLKQKLF